MSGTRRFVSFIWSKERFFQYKENAFYFTSKALFTGEM